MGKRSKDMLRASIQRHRGYLANNRMGPDEARANLQADLGLMSLVSSAAMKRAPPAAIHDYNDSILQALGQ